MKLSHLFKLLFVFICMAAGVCVPLLAQYLSVEGPAWLVCANCRGGDYMNGPLICATIIVELMLVAAIVFAMNDWFQPKETY